ncbi:MAG: hypothetical protein FJX76_23505 [Armatimonadetes bacterium]|nr:hypothetical protein [Armatimonadota bacterium]
MRTLEGKIFFNPLEGGIWAFESDDGERYQLDGTGKDACGEGRRIKVTGEVDNEAMGFGMVYPIFKVESYEVSPLDRPKKKKEDEA